MQLRAKGCFTGMELHWAYQIGLNRFPYYHGMTAPGKLSTQSLCNQ